MLTLAIVFKTYINFSFCLTEFLFLNLILSIHSNRFTRLFVTGLFHLPIVHFFIELTILKV
ncbi:protein of unknown function [Oenococcus oeni]|nr:hypothetical protein OENI_20050 [Oenococcus oeni]SYW00249.1 hypothetical protein OENI_20287 [Oenococcus oeni]SYW12017.1 hypothetical protein OENI_190007 [Oenococcus oeni]SYW14582.1 hypothetical protein OENI_560010 [Oenococcus oeni]SYW17622.1 hypothetical protein OENI_10290 [Oenococcus oeni]